MGIFSRLRQRLLGKADTPAPSADPVVGGLPLFQQFQRIGGQKTPQQVSAIIREADVGKPCRLVDLSNDMRQIDGHLQSSLFTRENALTPLDLIVDPWKQRGEKEPTTRDKSVADFVEGALESAIGDKGKKTRGLSDTVAQLQGAIYMGYAVDEIDWIRDGRYLVPGGFWPVDQRRFEFRQTDGRLVWADRWGSLGYGIDLMTDHPGKFIQHQPRINGDVPAREGLNKLLVWAAIFRNWTVADWLALAELTWKPWRIGLYPSGAGEADIDNLREALRWLTTNGIAAIRDDHKIDIRWPQGQSGPRSNHQALAEWLGAEISKAILGQTLTTEQGERGARSLGEVHYQVKQEILKYDAKCVAATLMMDLVRWIVWLNFGPETPLPNVYFDTGDLADIESFGQGLKHLHDAALRVPAKWARQQIGIPEPEDDEELLGAWEDVDTEELDEAA